MLNTTTQRTLAVLVVAIVAATAVVIGFRPDAEAGIEEPYEPFEMVYVQTDPEGRSSTARVLWSSRSLWSVELLASDQFPDEVGRITANEDGYMTISSPTVLENQTYFTDPTDGAVIPDDWFLPRDFAADSAFAEADASLGTRAFERTYEVSPGVDEHQILVVDDRTGLVISLLETRDGEVERSIEVTSLEVDRPGSPIVLERGELSTQTEPEPTSLR